MTVVIAIPDCRDVLTFLSDSFRKKASSLA